MVFLNLHVEFGLKHTMVIQLSYGVFWIKKAFIGYDNWWGASRKSSMSASLFFCGKTNNLKESLHKISNNNANRVANFAHIKKSHCQNYDVAPL
jgi:hypothetical protein